LNVATQGRCLLATYDSAYYNRRGSLFFATDKYKTTQGVTMPTWCFKAAERRTRESSTHQWYWQIDTRHTLIAITSTRLFPTIEECIADARSSGFRGAVDIPEHLHRDSVINCEEGDYVHAIVQESVQGRANRQVA
jgi:hypothetical protein